MTAGAELADDVRSWLATQPDRAELLAKLVAIPSLSGRLEQNDVAAAVRSMVPAQPALVEDTFVPDWEALPDLVSPVDGQRLWCPLQPADRYAEVLPHLTATVLSAGRGPGPTLMLNAHVDVVPADHQTWTADPFDPQVRGGRLVGRGAMDMKAGLLAAALAFGYLAARWPGPGTVQLAVVPEEETGGNGTLAVLARGHVPDAVVITEPTDLQVVHRHVGIQRFDARIAGRPGGSCAAPGAAAQQATPLASSWPSNSSNAIGLRGHRPPADTPTTICPASSTSPWPAVTGSPPARPPASCPD